MDFDLFCVLQYIKAEWYIMMIYVEIMIINKFAF